MRYLEMGFSIIPIHRNEKRPLIDGWQHYCEHLPTEEEVEGWIIQHPGANIGIACGPASGISVLDIDDDSYIRDPRLPKSPFIKRGKKGESRFFKYNPKVQSFSIGKIDYLSTGRQTIIPPSLHADTKKPYQWLSSEELDISAMPIIQDNIQEICKLFLPRLDDGSIKMEGLEGRNNTLKTQAAICRHAFMSVEECAAKILEYDLKMHKPPLFRDPTEQYFIKAKTDIGAAMLFAQRMYDFYDKKARDDVKQFIELVEKKEVKEEVLLLPPPFRKENIFLNKCAEAIQNESDKIIPALAIAGAIGIGSILLGNRFEVKSMGENSDKTLAPNLYLCAVGRTGIGKNSLLEFCKKILHDNELIGRGGYRSAQAVVCDLFMQRQRLDVIDEITSIFKTMTTSSSSSQTEMVETLCSLFTSSTGLFLGQASMNAKKEKQRIDFNNPFVSLVSVCTPEGLTDSVSELLISKGLFPRFLFFDQPYLELNNNHNPIDYSYFKNFINDFILEFPIERIDASSDLTADRPMALRCRHLSFAAEDFRLQLRMENHERIRSNIMSDNISTKFLTRRLEIILKLALIDSVLCGQQLVELKNMEWANDMFEYHLKCVEQIFKEQESFNNGRFNMKYYYDKILKEIRKTKSKGLLLSGMQPHWQYLTPNQRAGVIQNLLDGEEIIEIQKKRPDGKGKPSKRFYAVEFYRDEPDQVGGNLSL